MLALLNVLVQEDVDDEFEEESVLMDDTMDQTGNQGDGDISSQMHQVLIPLSV